MKLVVKYTLTLSCSLLPALSAYSEDNATIVESTTVDKVAKPVLGEGVIQFTPEQLQTISLENQPQPKTIRIQLNKDSSAPKDAATKNAIPMEIGGRSIQPKTLRIDLKQTQSDDVSGLNDVIPVEKPKPKTLAITLNKESSDSDKALKDAIPKDAAAITPKTISINLNQTDIILFEIPEDVAIPPILPDATGIGDSCCDNPDWTVGSFKLVDATPITGSQPFEPEQVTSVLDPEATTVNNTVGGGTGGNGGNGSNGGDGGSGGNGSGDGGSGDDGGSGGGIDFLALCIGQTADYNIQFGRVVIIPQASPPGCSVVEGDGGAGEIGAVIQVFGGSGFKSDTELRFNNAEGTITSGQTSFTDFSAPIIETITFQVNNETGNYTGTLTLEVIVDTSGGLPNTITVTVDDAGLL